MGDINLTLPHAVTPELTFAELKFAQLLLQGQLIELREVKDALSSDPMPETAQALLDLADGCDIMISGLQKLLSAIETAINEVEKKS